MISRRETAPPVDRIPAELQRSTPREVALTAAGRFVTAVMFALAVGAVVAFALLYAKAGREARRQSETLAQAARTEATVTGVRVTSGKNPERIIAYQFAAGNQSYGGTARVRRNQLQAVTVGAPVVVGYVPSRPQENWLTGHEPAPMPWALVAVIPLSMLLGAAAAAYTLRAQHRLLAEGRPALATVMESKRVRYGHGSTNRVRYEFTLPSGSTRTGRFDTNRAAPPAGATIVVLYDPDEPRRQGRYPFSLVRPL